MTKLIVGGAIAIILLGLYVYCIIVGVQTIQCITKYKRDITEIAKNKDIKILTDDPNIKTVNAGIDDVSKDFTDGFSTVLNVVGGLISALVISVLAITPPGTTPTVKAFFPSIQSEDVSILSGRIIKVISILYISIWLICGTTALVYGCMQHPNVVPELSAQGKSWLGLAVAAAYSYLGIK